MADFKEIGLQRRNLDIKPDPLEIRLWRGGGSCVHQQYPLYANKLKKLSGARARCRVICLVGWPHDRRGSQSP